MIRLISAIFMMVIIFQYFNISASEVPGLIEKAVGLFTALINSVLQFLPSGA